MTAAPKRTQYLWFVLPGLFLAAFLVRLAFYTFFLAPMAKTSQFTPFLFPDSLNFFDYARALAERGEYFDSAGRIAWRMPGYSLLLAGVLKMGFNSLLALHLPNLLLGALNTLLACLLGHKIFHSWRAGILAGTALAFYPFILFMDCLVLSDTLATTGALLLCAAATRFVQAQGWREHLTSSLLVALTAALCAYAKSSSGLLLVAFLPFFLLTQRYKPSGRHGPGLRWLAIMVVGFCALLYPWELRNERLLGEFVPFSTMGGFTLWEATGPGADGGANHGKVKMPQAWEDMQARMTSPRRTLADSNIILTYPLPDDGGALQFQGDTSAELASDAYLLTASLIEIKRAPNRAADLAVRKFLRTWSPLPNWVGAPFWPYGLLMLLSYGPVLLLSIFGISQVRPLWRTAYILYIPAIYFSLVHAIFMGSVRYRVPAEACLIVLAAGVIDLLLASRFRKNP